MENERLEHFRCDNYCEGLLKRLRAHEDLYDVVLIAGDSGKRISAHRLILLAASDYFSALLCGSCREAQEREITLNGIDGDALEHLVNYCYTGSLELRGERIETLLMTADYLQLKDVTDGCCDYIQRHIEPSNCLDVGIIAEKLNLKNLLRTTRDIICKNFEEVSNNSKFMLLTAKHLSEFLAADDLRVPSETFVCKVLMKWIEFDPDSRRQHLAELLAQVRLSLLQPSFLLEKVEPLCDTIESKDLILNALKSHHMVASIFPEPRNYLSKNMAKHLLAIYTIGEKLVIADYNRQTKGWTMCNTSITSHYNFAVALMDDNLITVGGSSHEVYSNSVTSLNLSTMAITKMASLKKARSGPGVIVLNGEIYVMGGIGHHSYTVEKWDPDSRLWKFMTSMEACRACPSVATINDLLYVSGGYDLSNFCRAGLKSVECYNPIENIWRPAAPMKVERCAHCLAAYNGYLFAIGGNRRDDRVERYDPRTDTWTTIPCSPSIMGHTRSTSLGMDIFIYNNSNIYEISRESSCEYLELRQVIPDSMDVLKKYGEFLELIAIPCEFRPSRSWIKKTESPI